MKHQNIIALCLGIFVAALLWQYYLWPKYQLKRESPEIMSDIEKSAQKELEESINSDEHLSHLHCSFCHLSKWR